jgi:hypothetical protein
MMKHCDQVLALLTKQISNPEEVEEIRETAAEVAKRWVKPLSGGKEETNGLIYGLVQSGKTGVLTVSGAIGADEGYRTILILTSDNDPLYEQTLGRVREAFPGIDILGKADFRDTDAFLQRLKSGTCALVTTKNAGLLKTLVENFKKGNLKGLSCLIIDDEADQASLNTRESKADGSRSAINDRITELRGFFDKNTYLQVTATPQALFLQSPKHSFRPKFTQLSHPGHDYVGGEDFFGEHSTLVREFDLHDINLLTAGGQPHPKLEIPKSLLKALDTFMVGATYKRLLNADQNSAFLCHVSTKTADHKHIEDLLRRYKMELAGDAKAKKPALVARLSDAYNDLASTHEGLASTKFDKILEAIAFFSPGIAVKLVNGQTDEDVAVQSPYNLFVGGNKLGRGVTIKNLLVSYYGRNPKKPQSDTVLQHARMYGYRRGDIGLLRLFLPPELNTVFKAIHKMERGLRELIEKSPSEEFRGLYVESAVSATRRNVLAPGAVGVYAGGGTYNPAQVLRDQTIKSAMAKIDAKLDKVKDKQVIVLSLDEIAELIRLTRPDPEASERVWDQGAVAASVAQMSTVLKHVDGYVYVDRGRGLKQNRRETQGILEGGEAGKVPSDKLTLFMLRTVAEKGQEAAWWPQIRFPSGRYAFAFAV